MLNLVSDADGRSEEKRPNPHLSFPTDQRSFVSKSFASNRMFETLPFPEPGEPNAFSWEAYRIDRMLIMIGSRSQIETLNLP